MKKILQRQLIYSLHACTRTQTLTHSALNSGTNGPQWVGYKGGDVMSVMETVCPFTSDPFLTQLSLLTQRTKERQTERKWTFFFFYPFPHPLPANLTSTIKTSQ